MSAPLKTSPISESESLNRFRSSFEPELLGWLDRKASGALAPEAESSELTSRLREFVARGGKRLRPALVSFAYRGCGGLDDGAILPVAMSTELLHTYLLIHDDIIDDAPVRRGRPSVHRLFEQDHQARAWPGSSERHGESAAILLGDLAHSYAVELFMEGRSRLGVDALSECFTAMCQEVVLGQYLEMTVPFRANATKEGLLEVLRLKSGRYSVERPIALGALAAKAPIAAQARLKEYGEALGEAFQLKDDLLGVFGASDTVGKSVDSDIAEGKLTVLVQQALERAAGSQSTLLRAALGNREATQEELSQAREVVAASGARSEVERMIETRLERAGEALEGIELTGEASSFFAGLIAFLRDREH